MRKYTSIFSKFIISKKSLGSISFFLLDRYIFLAFFGRRAYSRHIRKRDIQIIFIQICFLFIFKSIYFHSSFMDN